MSQKHLKCSRQKHAVLDAPNVTASQENTHIEIEHQNVDNVLEITGFHFVVVGDFLVNLHTWNPKMQSFYSVSMMSKANDDYSLLVLDKRRKTGNRPDITEKNVDWDVKHQNKQNPQLTH